MAAPVLSVDNQQAVGMALSCFNQGVTLSLISDTTVNGANTYAVFYSRVQANGAPGAVNTEINQADLEIVLRGLNVANTLGILTDANLSGLTTVASVRALYTTSAPYLPSTYSGWNIQ